MNTSVNGHAAVVQGIARGCPRLARLLREHGATGVAQYAATLWEPQPTVISPQARQARAALCAELLSQLELRLPEEEARAALHQFEECPVIQTADHAQLLLDPVAFHNNFVYYLGALGASRRYLFTNACSTVTLETRQGQGPGWLQLRGARVNIFGLRRRTMTGSSVCAAPGPVRFHFRIGAFSSLHEYAEARYLDHVRGLIGGRQFPNVAEAFEVANQELWRSWDVDRRTVLVFTDDRLTAAVVARHLDDEGSILSRLLFDPAMRARLELELDRLRTGVRRLALRDTTRYFWGVRGGRTRALCLENGMLREAGSSEGVRLPFRRDLVARALRAGELYPDLFVGFAALTILPGVRALGGSSQMIYLPVIATACASVLQSLGAETEELLYELRRPQYDGWVAGVIEGDDPVTFLASLPPGRQLAHLASRWADVPLHTSVGEMRLFRYLKGWQDELAGSI